MPRGVFGGTKSPLLLDLPENVEESLGLDDKLSLLLELRSDILLNWFSNMKELVRTKP
jgi:hypothetical protein